MIILIISMIFILFGDHWLYVIYIYILSLTYDNLFFHFLFVLGYGYIILVIWGLLNYLYHRTGIYLFDFFLFVFFGILMYVIILFLFYDHCFWDECKGFFYYP